MHEETQILLKCMKWKVVEKIKHLVKHAELETLLWLLGFN